VAKADPPHRIIVQRVAYRLDPSVIAPVAVERFGTDAEGRVIFVDPSRAASRRHLYLAAPEPALVGYVRDDPPPGYSLLDAVGSAFDEALPRPDALALLGLLIAHHVVLVDGTRLGAGRERLVSLIARISLEPDGFARQVARVPDWALAEALRPRLDALRGRLIAAPWIREIGRPEVGYVRQIGRRDVLIALTTREPVDVGAVLLVRPSADGRPPVTVRVESVEQRDVRVGQIDESRDEGIGNGDPVEFVAVERRPGTP